MKGKKAPLNIYEEIVIHHWMLYDKGDIFHRDLSNLSPTYEYLDARIVGILNDFDVAVDKTTTPNSNRRTGYAVFMAQDLLDVRRSATHVYRHELESFFYLVIWTAVGYKGSWRIDDQENPLQKWHRGSWLDIAGAKSLLFFHLADFETIWNNINITEDNKPLVIFTEKFYLVLRSAFNKANIISLDFLETHSEDIGNAEEAGNDLLNKLLTWDKVKDLFQNAA